MNKKQKRITFIGVLVIFIIIAGVAGIRYIPFNRILKISSSPEEQFVNKKPLPTQAPNTVLIDFEIDPKTGNRDGLYQGKAHSGQFSTKAFGKNSYSAAITRTAGDIGTGQLDGIGMSAWVYVFPTEKEIEGAFVLAVNNDLGVNILWKGVFVSGPRVPEGEWFKISGFFDLASIQWKPDFKLQIYFWNNSSTDILVDDYYIVFGGPKQRKGDSTLVDMTKGESFQPVANKPPFPFIFLQAFDVNNRSTLYLINDGNRKEGKIEPGDRIYAGNFSGAADGKDDLLVMKQNGTSEVFHFNADKNFFVRITKPIPPERLKNLPESKTVKGEMFFSGIFDKSGIRRTFRYNRDWRFDLKEIKYNDTTPEIIANIDFSGYEIDHNPKYYEKLLIVTGKFFDPSVTSFCVVAVNCKNKVEDSRICHEWEDLPVLPNKIQFYIYPDPTK